MTKNMMLYLEKLNQYKQLSAVFFFFGRDASHQSDAMQLRDNTVVTLENCVIKEVLPFHREDITVFA